ncbi:MAG: hypothetical protein ACI9FB_002709 [Candidatus Azotimanducaceae bacterium]|jgi:hypothetical protein
MGGNFGPVLLKRSMLIYLQYRIAIKISEAIRSELGLPQKKSRLKMARYQTCSLRAYELVIKACNLIQSIDGFKVRENREEVDALFDQALTLDPKYPSTLVGKGYFLIQRGMFEETAKLAEHSLTTQETAGAQALLGEIAIHNLQWPEALVH